MKSSSNVIRVDESNAELPEWMPIEFEQTDLISADLIRSSALDFFGIKIGNEKEQRKNLIKADNNSVVYQQWQPSDMNDSAENSKKTNPQSWIPFIEQPNPRKMADKLINEAKVKSNEIIKEAQEAANQEKKEAYEQGFESAKNEIKETLQAAVALINVAREWRSDMMSQAEPMIMDLVKKMAQKMFGDGIILDNVTLQQHFASVLESTRSLGDLRIFMNPLDAKVLGPDWREYQASVLGNKVEIVSNESIKRGGCYIQGEWGTADALVETQLTTILDQFSEVEQPEKGDE